MVSAPWDGADDDGQCEYLRKAIDSGCLDVFDAKACAVAGNCVWDSDRRGMAQENLSCLNGVLVCDRSVKYWVGVLGRRRGSIGKSYEEMAAFCSKKTKKTCRS